MYISVSNIHSPSMRTLGDGVPGYLVDLASLVLILEEIASKGGGGMVGEREEEGEELNLIWYQFARTRKGRMGGVGQTRVTSRAAWREACSCCL